jgi:hypothetical protein
MIVARSGDEITDTNAKAKASGMNTCLIPIVLILHDPVEKKNANALRRAIASIPHITS